ncbi:ENV2 protein, partial [Certhia brachydactyla]|nr:ENV2 protein [Certhia brachydactyla]NXO97566.1 ENV2 protein [Certhia brachydactyla]
PAYKNTGLWKIMQATFGVLNQTHPNLTKGCWLCYIASPLFYEALGSPAKSRRVNGTNPKECLWRSGSDRTPGITIEQIRGQGRCVG